jgi:hypothetical protein
MALQARKPRTPFWLDFAKKLDWDPRKEIRTYATSIGSVLPG